MNDTPTPRTDEEIQRYMMTYFITQEDDDGYAVKANFARQLETELTAITEQRDRLAEALRVINTYDPKDGQCDDGYTPVFHARKALAAVKGGADE